VIVRSQLEQALAYNQTVYGYVKRTWTIETHHKSYPSWKFDCTVKTVMMAIMIKTNDHNPEIFPKELIHWVIELIGADPVWWLLPGYAVELTRNKKKKKINY